MKEQSFFFKKLYKMGSWRNEKAFHESIADILCLSLSGAYKKINGHNKLTYADACLLSDSIDMDIEIVERAQRDRLFIYPFVSDDLTHPPTAYETWAQNIYNHSLDLDKLRPNYKVINYQSELSYFHYFGFKQILFFKLYTWNKTSWDISELDYYDSRRFALNKTLNQTITKLEKHYLSYGGVDIWYQDLLTPLLKQIGYYKSLGAFRKEEDFKQLVKELYKLLDHLENICKTGKKKSFGKPQNYSPMDIYINQTHRSNNIIFVEKGDYKLTYGAFLNPNFIRTNDNSVCSYTNKWLDRALSQSVKISNSGEKDRNIFFKVLKNQLDEFVEAHS